MAETLETRVCEVIDLNRSVKSQLHKLERLAKRATVFLSYSRSDTAEARRIGDALKKHDYRVWTEADLHPGGDWAAALGAAIDEAVKHGFVLLLLSEASLRSELCRQESLYALQRASAPGRSNVVPVILNQFDFSALPPEIRHIQHFDLVAGPFDERMQLLIRGLKAREME